MSDYFGQKDYHQLMGMNGKYTIAEEGSLLVAQANLLKKLALGYDVDPITLDGYFQEKGIYRVGNDGVRDDLRWDSIHIFDRTISIEKLDRGWPKSNNAIVKFHFQSVQQPTILLDGEEVPNMIEHSCLMANFKKKLIIDSYDGDIKPAGSYGDPVGYAIYTVPELKASKSERKHLSHIWVEGDNIWVLAFQKGYDALEVLDHNGIDDPKTIKPGDKILFPNWTPTPTPEVTYDIFEPVKPMHIARKGGSRKFLFGNVTRITDLLNTGPTMKQGHNLDIAALAHIPIDDKDFKYYMEARALGDYKTTGRVSLPAGFDHTHLAEGHLETAPITPPPIVMERLMETAEEALRSDIIEALVVAQAEPEGDDHVDTSWKETYRSYPAPVRYTNVSRTHLVLKDYDHEHKACILEATGDIIVAGTFINPDGVECYRALRHVENLHDDPDWHPTYHGLPVASELKPYVEPTDDVYNGEVTLPERVAAGLPITRSQAAWALFCRYVAKWHKTK